MVPGQVRGSYPEQVSTDHQLNCLDHMFEALVPILGRIFAGGSCVSMQLIEAYFK